MQPTQFEEQTTFFPYSKKYGLQSSPGKLLVPESDNQPLLFKPYSIQNLVLKNRIVTSSMCTYSADDGFFSDWHLVHLGGFAVGGAGLIMTEATAVEPRGRISPYDTGLWKDDHIEPLEKIVSFVHSQGAAIGIQLAHAGRKGSTNAPFHPQQFRASLSKSDGGWDVLGPSSQPYNDKLLIPTEMTESDIREVISKFATAAERALKAGFDVIEILGGHGYLIGQFLSPLSNKRTDSYGGSFEGRTKFLSEIIRAIRKVWDQPRPFFLRISCEDWVEGGWTIEDTLKLASLVRDLGVDALDCSSGGLSPLQKINAYPGFQVPLSKAVKAEVGSSLTTLTVGMITSGKQAEEILQNGDADLVCFGRPFLRSPAWPFSVAEELGVSLKRTIPYHYVEDPLPA